MKNKSAIELYYVVNMITMITIGICIGNVVTDMLHKVSAVVFNGTALTMLLLTSAVTYAYKNQRIRQWLISHCALVLFTDVVFNAIVTWYGIYSGDLVMRYVLFGTVINVLRQIISLYIESIKEKLGDGASIFANLSMSENIGHGIGLAASIAMTYFGITMSFEISSILLSVNNALDCFTLYLLVKTVMKK